MGNNWIECLLEEHGELHEALDARVLEIKLIIKNSIVHFDNVNTINIVNGKLCIDDLEVIEMNEIKKIITLHLFDSLDNYSDKLLLRKTNKLIEYKNHMCIESVYTPDMCFNL